MEEILHKEMQQLTEGSGSGFGNGGVGVGVLGEWLGVESGSGIYVVDM